MIKKYIFVFFSCFAIGLLESSDIELTPKIIQKLRAYVEKNIKDPKNNENIITIPEEALICIGKRNNFKCIVVTWQDGQFGRSLECCIPFEKERELFEEQ